MNRAGKLIILAAGMALLWGCQAVFFGARTSPSLAASRGTDRWRGAERVRPLVDKVWASGFFRRNEVVRREILNNGYGVFEKDSRLAESRDKGLACLSRAPGRPDFILLRADLLPRVKVTIEGVFEPADTEERALPLIVHELCHDLWNNVLDEGERSLFTAEAEEFLKDYVEARTEKKWRSFLEEAGEPGAAGGEPASFSRLEFLIRSYPSETRFGAELFAWLGEHAYSGKLPLPPRFRKYFCGLVSDRPCGGGEKPN